MSTHYGHYPVTVLTIAACVAGVLSSAVGPRPLAHGASPAPAVQAWTHREIAALADGDPESFTKDASAEARAARPMPALVAGVRLAGTLRRECAWWSLAPAPKAGAAPRRTHVPSTDGLERRLRSSASAWRQACDDAASP